MDITDTLADPAWFPDRLDPANRLIRLVHTSHETLARSAFLDGRTAITLPGTRPLVIGLNDFAAAAAPSRPPSMRWILHNSFCGSTLLAHIVTVKNHALCLREPQVLVDLAEWRMALPDADRPLFAATLSATLSMLTRRWHPSEAIVIKPSNWINPLLTDFWQPMRGDRAVYVGIAPDDFLVAVLRGGRDRIAYALRLYERFTRTWPVIGSTVDDALVKTDDALARATCLVAALHWAQETVKRAHNRSQASKFNAARIQFPDFLDRHSAITQVVETLAINIPPPVLATSIANHIDRHAKHSDRVADRNSEAATNRMVRKLNAAAFEAGMAVHTALESLGPEIEIVIADAMRQATYDMPKHPTMGVRASAGETT